MAPTGEALREQLLAAIEAASEFDHEDRHLLAEVFLDQLHASYDLVPRATATKTSATKRPKERNGNSPWVPIALTLAFLFFVLPAAAHHLPVVLVYLLGAFIFIKTGAFGMCRRPVQG